MGLPLTAVVVLKTLTLVLGGLITFYSARAFGRTGSPALRALAIGFGLVTLGSFLAGVSDRVLGYPPMSALVVESAFTAVGFGTILYSLYLDHDDGPLVG